MQGTGNGVCRVLSVLDALQIAIDFVGAGSNVIMEWSGSGGFQIRSTSLDARGVKHTRIGRLDINPASGHVRKWGAHLNLQERIGKQVIEAPLNHTSIDPSTIRLRDYQQPGEFKC